MCSECVYGNTHPFICETVLKQKMERGMRLIIQSPNHQQTNLKLYQTTQTLQANSFSHMTQIVPNEESKRDSDLTCQ